MTNPPVRRTRQRSAVADVLDSLAEFRTAQDIHELLRARGERIGLATVYRTLQVMSEAGEADVVRTPDGQAAYRGCGQASGHHHHLICRTCGRTVEIELDDMEAIVGALATKHGFSDVGHELELFGRCADCARKAADDDSAGRRDAGEPAGDVVGGRAGANCDVSGHR